jgi:hypothetical protein
MAAFKKAESGYRGKANTADGATKGTAKVNQELTEGPVKGKGTPQIDKYTKQYLASAKAKNVVGKK